MEQPIQDFPPLSPPPSYAQVIDTTPHHDSKSSFVDKRRRQRAESRSVLDGFMFDKMNNLEGMVARMQDALSQQTFAISDVKDQLTDINKELGKMYDAKDPSIKFAIRAQVRPVDASGSRPRSRQAGRHSSQRSSISSLQKVHLSSEEGVPMSPETPTPMDIMNSVIKEEDGHVDPFEIVADDVQDDEDYARVCKMLQGLLSEAHGAIATGVDVPSEEEEEEFKDALDDVAHSQALVLSPILPQMSLYAEPSELEEAKKLEAALASLEQDQAESTMDTITHKSVAAGEAVEVRFYCQVIRGGHEPVRHELRRKLIVPLMTANNTNFLRRLLVGSSDGDDGEVTGISGALIRHTPHNLAVLAARAVGTVQLMYWMLLMTIGALMMDVYLCELAGKQVVKVVQVLSPAALEEASEKALMAKALEPAVESGAIRDTKVKQIEDMPQEMRAAQGPRPRRRHRRVSF